MRPLSTLLAVFISVSCSVSSSHSFVLDQWQSQSIDMRFQLRDQLCNADNFIRFSYCGDSPPSSPSPSPSPSSPSLVHKALISTSRSTQRVLLSTPDALDACGEEVRNQTYWSWTVNCTHGNLSDAWLHTLDQVLLVARRRADSWMLSVSHTAPLLALGNCLVVVQPVLHVQLLAAVRSCPDGSSTSTSTSSSTSTYPFGAVYSPQVTADGVQLSVTYWLQVSAAVWQLACGRDARFHPDSEACLRVAVQSESAGCPRWLVFTQFSQTADGECATVEHNGTSFTVQSAQFHVRSGRLYVCEHTLNERPSDEDWQRLAERCLYIVSAVADLANIFVHLTLRAQRTLPGRIVLCLSGTLFASDLSCFLLTFLRSVESLWLCFTLRSFAHCLSLSASCWTQVLWYDLWLTISASRTVDSCRHLRTRFLRYVLFCWAIPIAFPATRLAVDVHTALHIPADDENGQSMRLTVCNHQPLFYYLAFSAIPVSCILMMNTVFLTRSCCLIRRVVQDTERVGISNNFMSAQQRFGLYTKLFFLCGFTSLFGFVSEILKSQNASESLNEVLSRVSGILDSSLGLCVSLPFLCEPRVGIRFVRAIFITQQKPPRVRQLPNPVNRAITSHVLCNQVIQ